MNFYIQDEEDEQDNSLFKLTRINRRVYPLSLFNTPDIDARDLYNINTPQELPKTTPKPMKKQILHKKLTKNTKNTKISIPPLTYKQIINKKPENDLSQRLYFQPNNIKLSPRSKLVIYSLKPLTVETPKPTRPKKLKNFSIAEKIEEPITNIKLSRITSSKITFPSKNVGQIMMRVRDLVLDPLRKELIDNKIINS